MWKRAAAALKTLLLDLKAATEQARAQGKRWLDPLEGVDWEAQLLRLLDEGDQAHPRWGHGSPWHTRAMQTQRRAQSARSLAPTAESRPHLASRICG
jgi:hypothetical protein